MFMLGTIVSAAAVALCAGVGSFMKKESRNGCGLTKIRTANFIPAVFLPLLLLLFA